MTIVQTNLDALLIVFIAPARIKKRQSFGPSEAVWTEDMHELQKAQQESDTRIGDLFFSGPRALKRRWEV